MPKHFNTPGKVAGHVNRISGQRPRRHGKGSTRKSTPKTITVSIKTGGQPPNQNAIRAAERCNRRGVCQLQQTNTGFEGTIVAQHGHGQGDDVPRQIAAAQGIMTRPAEIRIKDPATGRERTEKIHW